MAITIDLAAPWLRNDNRAFATMVQGILTHLVQVNRQSLRLDPTIPPLYQSGVYYLDEEPDYDSFVDLYKVLEQGHGDCAHLVAWRVAELNERQREPATIFVEWRVKPGSPRLFHVKVRRANGALEDPSKLLGM